MASSSLRRLHVGREVLRLAQDRLLPCNAQPGEIFEDAGDVLLAAAGNVDVLDADEEAAAQPPRHVEPGQGGKRMPEMQRAVGARRKAKDRN